MSRHLDVHVEDSRVTHNDYRLPTVPLFSHPSRPIGFVFGGSGPPPQPTKCDLPGSPPLRQSAELLIRNTVTNWQNITTTAERGCPAEGPVGRLQAAVHVRQHLHVSQAVSQSVRQFVVHTAPAP
eukprot:1179336-Prorocentrum_minimum.AAC.2